MMKSEIFDQDKDYDSWKGEHSGKIEDKWQIYCWTEQSYKRIMFNVSIGPKSDHCLPSSVAN